MSSDTENPDDAAVALFTRLCRQSPRLRAWLWDEFARSAKTREQFANILAQPGKTDNLTLAHAASEDRARDLENARLRKPQLRERYNAMSKGELIRKLMFAKMERAETADARNRELGPWVKENPSIVSKVEQRLKTAVAGNRQSVDVNIAQEESVGARTRSPRLRP